MRTFLIFVLAVQAGAAWQHDLLAGSAPIITQIEPDLNEGSPINSIGSEESDSRETIPLESETSSVVPESRHDATPADKSVGRKTGAGKTVQRWAVPEQLIAQLRALAEYQASAAWAETTIQIIAELTGNQGLLDPNSVVSLKRLHQQLEQIDRLINDGENTEFDSRNQLISELMRSKYSIQRRLGIWEMVHQLAKNEKPADEVAGNRQVARYLSASSQMFRVDQVDRGWAEYLELEAAADSFNTLNPNKFEQKKSARQVLARLYSPALSQDQKQHLYSTIDLNLVNMLRSNASESVDLAQFLKRVERFESDANGASQYYLNDEYQNLLWSHEAGFQELAQYLQTHYRNANVRVTVSERLLNNLVPDVPDSFEPFHDRIFGARVYGQNKISNQIRIRLIPDPAQISLRLETAGQVHSQTMAERSGFTIENEGNSRFKVIKRLAFGRQGIFAYRPETQSEMTQRVVGMQSNLDGIPLIGRMARRIARKKIEQQSPMTEKYARQKLEQTAEDRFEEEVEDNLNQLRQYVTTSLLQPLIALDLEPEPVEISTTAQRVLMRYRLAGRDQMAANTPRPQALQSCLMSIQIHETAINNLISRIELAGKTFDPIQLQTHLREVLGTNAFANADQIQRDVQFEFAPFDPVRIDLDDNQIGLSVNLKSLRIGKGKTWKNLQIKTRYNPTVRGVQFLLTQDDSGIELKGKRLNAGDYIAVRTIFSSLFESQFGFPGLPEKLTEKLGASSLAVNQLVIANGWIGVSIDETTAQTAGSTSHGQRQPRGSVLRISSGSSIRR